MKVFVAIINDQMLIKVMTKIIYERYEVTYRGQGKKKRVSIKGIFYDQARPDKQIAYNLHAIRKAIIDRQRKGKETVGLEMGLEKILAKYESLGIIPPESRENKRRRQHAFAQG